MSSIFTPPGQSLRNNQNQNNANLSNFGTGIATSLKPLIDQQIGYASSLEPNRENSINSTLKLMSMGNQQAAANKAIGGINSNLANETGNVANELRSQGASAGAIAGATSDLGNNAANETNNITTGLYDPARQAMLQQLIMQVVGQGQNVGALGSASQAAGIAEGAPQVQVGPGIGDYLGGALGQWAGGGFKTGGGSSSGFNGHATSTV